MTNMYHPFTFFHNCARLIIILCDFIKIDGIFVKKAKYGRKGITHRARLLAEKLI